MDRATHWSVTINNPTDADREALKNPPQFVKKVMYQDEIGEGGTLHIQGYANTAQVRLSQLKKWLPRAHLEVARDKNALMKYVQKAETSVEGTQKVVETEYLRMDQALLRLAHLSQTMSIHIDIDAYIEATEQKRKQMDKDHFWKLVKVALKVEPRQVGLFTNPQLERAWLNTRSVWMELNSEQQNIQDASQDQAFNETSGTQDAQDARSEATC